LLRFSALVSSWTVFHYGYGVKYKFLCAFGHYSFMNRRPCEDMLILKLIELWQGVLCKYISVLSILIVTVNKYLLTRIFLHEC